MEGPFEIPESWEWCKVIDIANSILYGVSESAKSSGKYRLLRITDIQDNNVDWDSVPFTNFDSKEAGNYILQDGDILFARTGATVGKSYLVEGIQEESIYASYLIRIQTNRNVSPKYIKRFFESGYYWEQISSSSVGVGQPNVNGTSLANLFIPIPSLMEQKRIVAESDKWFTLIEALDKETKNLSQNIERTKSQILSLAISGKLVPQDPSDEPAIELLKRINPDFKPCDNSHYNKIPLSWIYCKLSDICSDFIVPQRDKPTKFDGDIPWCRIEDIDGKYLNGSHSGQNVSLKTIKEMNMRICPVGTVICSCSASIGVQAIVKTECCTNQTFIGLVCKHSALFNEYLYHFLSSQTKHFLDIGTGTTIKYISREKFENYVIPLPPIKEQRRIVERIEYFYSILEKIALGL